MGGNQSTHVANAYHCDIWVKCDAEKRSNILASSYCVDVKSDRSVGFGETQASSSGGSAASDSAQLDLHRIQTDFSRIGPKEYLRFDVPLPEGIKHVYISIFGQDRRVITNGLQRFSDTNIIVTRDGYIRDAAHGSIWKDEHGNDHRYK